MRSNTVTKCEFSDLVHCRRIQQRFLSVRSLVFFFLLLLSGLVRMKKRSKVDVINVVEDPARFSYAIPRFP